MASFASTLQLPPATFLRRTATGPKCATTISSTPTRLVGLRLDLKVQIPVTKVRSMVVSCAIAQPETLQAVQSTIAKQLSIDETTVTPQTKFADLGADSLDTVEIMMALEGKFEVSIGEGGAENISTVQDAADLIERVKTGTA
ncbi:Acyl carrier protein 1 [Abeliophyllum distichum]|uniref:Acyl carrier protein n=1 Tax=Abeliophyllum distichum TaxID=126358 RepID=A0ABD1QIJ8_9LAMI